MPNLIGKMLGAYQITAELGRGGMANVYRAVQPSVKREVAIKVLPAHFLQDQTFLQRFNREAEVIARLQHPRILPIYDFGEQDGLPYIVMAYMPGGTLGDLIKKSQGGLPLDETARLVAQIAEGLDYAHREGVIHRDFKPSNVLLDKQGNVHLADFGIAKVTADTAQLTGSGMVGTPQYMAPEMSDPGGLSPLVDIYALGITLYQMLTGRHPYEAPTPMGVLLAHANKPIPDARQQRSGLPHAAQVVIETAMAKNPGDRYASAEEMAKALAAAVMEAVADSPDTLAVMPVAEDKTRKVSEPILTVAPTPQPASVTEAAPAAARAAGRKLNWLWIGGAVVGLTIIVGAVALWPKGGQPAVSETSPPTQAANNVIVLANPNCPQPVVTSKDNVILVARWSATTVEIAESSADHLDLMLTVDGVLVGNVKEYRQPARVYSTFEEYGCGKDEDAPLIDWDIPLGNLAPGTHTVFVEFILDEAVTDGNTITGPGSVGGLTRTIEVISP